jgi:hypothetical protein
MNCKYGEETLFEENKSCINTESEYYEEFVDDRDLCMCWEDMNEVPILQ